MLKKEARQAFRKKRDGLSPSDQMRWDDLLLIHFQTIELPFIDYVLSFYPIEENREINSFIITDFLHFRNPGLHICYPKISMKDSSMQAIICNPDTVFETNSYNIPEPLDTDAAAPGQIDLVLVPLLAFDNKGHRVGYGKGFYDRFLSQCRPDCIKVGFSYFGPVEEITDAGEYDIPLDFCITPHETYVF